MVIYIFSIFISKTLANVFLSWGFLTIFLHQLILGYLAVTIFYEWPDLPIKTCLNLPHSLWVLKFATQIPPLLVWSWKHWNLPLPFCIVPTPFYSIANAIPSHLSTVLGMIGLSPLFLGFTELWSLANLILVHGPDKARQGEILSCYLPLPL